jgi:hypothetical protein
MFLLIKCVRYVNDDISILGPDQSVSGRDAPPVPLPAVVAKEKQKAVDIYLDDEDVPILPSYNLNGRAKDLQKIFRAFVTAHYSESTSLISARRQ